jgi:hypothetical protein
MGIMKNKKLYFGLGILGLVLVCSAAHFDLELAPERQFRVIDTDGRPFAGATVRHIWEQYSLGKSWEIETRSDDEGIVSLQRRTVRTSILSLIAGAITQIRKYGIHASFWSDDTILIFVSGYPQHTYFGGRGLQEGRAVIRKGLQKR